MAPQSSTPSPRRFLLTKRPQGHTTPTPSKLSNQVLQDASDSSTPRPMSGPSPSQFARVPRFAMSTARRASFPPRSPSPAKQQHSALGVVHGNARELPREPITIADDDEEMLDTEHANLDFAALTQPISQDSIPEPEQGAYLTSYTPSSPKRRKVDIGDLASTPQPTPGRLVISSSGTTRMMFTQADGETSSSSRPAFLMASLPPPESVAPLPDAFSPRRRGQKYVPGGLASELQSWVIEAVQTASQGRPRILQQVDNSVHVVSVDGTKGNGPVFAHGTASGGRPAKVLLIDGQANQKAGRVKAGDQVSIRQPTWDVQVDGEAWTVGVDWRTMKI
ncbi:hypothetical protein AUEXF2481DRAFT_25920 [Aureobasidium subglaciale EXF-2481]|uniref:Uncharacterized protein n=1 Tax=Aureobasidium subglaciale (strain EXF-2481) TaxID=1043005 RepID=A0A074YWW6_AURSE|nr:uncharacterized protein AUEXF2481DRAFT_25920 [Aureobasidium subglaciale EXF-2481]KAI5203532.1 hypothetical protein E4T38_05161 [Aureobasidium subglaciale]KAI5222007.1 hypothetical protein E4T40_05199 [Aureobasidium subglaciale]KAI5225910.1 hypothetical protein E4T41_05018 [Aureobasidium subglaciale]KAI5261969.1 hypothetical protein E4T46_04911 [Aureobasidium subglaciale]KEQ98652.1 hypothetical protein AUEXF2481DRAFT_25920 [Aureobasidium subglaciale EXF-2481]